MVSIVLHHVSGVPYHFTQYPARESDALRCFYLEMEYTMILLCSHHIHDKHHKQYLAHTHTGVVYQARDKQTGDIVALKRCLPHHEASDGFPLTTLREITILRELQCAGGQRHGIIGLKDVTVSSRYDFSFHRVYIIIAMIQMLQFLLGSKLFSRTELTIHIQPNANVQSIWSVPGI